MWRLCTLQQYMKLVNHVLFRCSWVIPFSIEIVLFQLLAFRAITPAEYIIWKLLFLSKLMFEIYWNWRKWNAKRVEHRPKLAYSIIHNSIAWGAMSICQNMKQTAEIELFPPYSLLHPFFFECRQLCIVCSMHMHISTYTITHVQ